MIDNYKDWEIFMWVKPIPDRSHDWEATHKNYNGPGDMRHFTGPSRDDLIEQIEEYEAEKEAYMIDKARQKV